MDDFVERVKAKLIEKPGMTKAKLAEALGEPFDQDFRDRLDQACEHGAAHKVMDKFYPGERSKY